MRKVFVLIAFLIALSSQAQNCDCLATFNWVKKTFEENDAGFSFSISNKGEEAYRQHNATFSTMVKSIDSSTECRDAIRGWLSFFRSGHLTFNTNNQSQNNAETNALSNEQIIEKYKDWEVLNLNIEEFKEYLNAKNILDYEGIWVNGPYEIGIKKMNNDYVGFIIKADGVYWQPFQIKLRIKSDNSSTYYMRDHSAEQFSRTELLGNNYLEMGFVTLKRTVPETKNDPNLERYFKAINAQRTYLEKVNNTTLLLRIPRFSGSHKKDIDSVIAANKDAILNTKNLIIDLRNNGGGSDRSFQELVPILYTNPIRSVGVEFLSTPLNNQRMLDFIEKPEYDFTDEEKKWAKESFDKLSTQIGEFVNLKSSMVSITNLDEIHEYPKNIGIIINENNASTTEQFLLLAKQSKKVKLFGTTTEGILDISNMYRVDSPCGDYVLGYGLSRSMRIPDMAIDEKGIRPDYYLDKEIPKYMWIDHVHKMLNNE